jgi:hypothetical protein
VAVEVYLEAGAKRVFACAVDWPGWARSGRDEARALEALEACRARYTAALGAHGSVPAGPFEVVERIPGNATTDFGAPGVVPDLDRTALDARRATKLAEILEACWDHLDGVAARAPAELRKGPRGGGRDRDQMLQHVLNAEAMYATRIGVKVKEPAAGDSRAIQEFRARVLEVVGAPSAAVPATERAWPVRYFTRRAAWHVLDHAWEMEDRST